MAKVQPSELKETIEIHEAIKLKEKGITKYEYNQVGRLRAKVKHDKSNFFYDSDTRKKTQSLVFITHKRNYINEEKFVLYKNQYYRITEVVPMDDHLYCQIFAEVVI